MGKTNFFYENNKSIGLKTRTNTYGKEYDLVWEFISYYEKRFYRYNKNNKLAVFVEPKIESTFPDIVLASYDETSYDNWSTTRNLLTVQELKILSILINKRSCDGEYFIRLGYDAKQILRSLERLLDCGLIRRTARSWQVEPTSTFFGVKQLMAIEAKLYDVKSVYEQTLLNTWFASESYALLPVKQPQNSTRDLFYKNGLGLYTKPDGFKKVLQAKKKGLPTSYVSLQFNEWIGKSLNR
ncbi:hypothetical protein FDP56_01390 [Enterococcus casseliflavus]|uniref:hypothetical protein n=1 Tax=Enterococcus casseliflavus TaxID=37734 RepID=UPI00129D03D4|nr:hypothetical protein [Enterococcus casseliflavus]MRI69077.1 hypothetical protein [Enterococcus casseliflavus]